MTDRDTFAAAALTGLLANEDLLADDDKVAETAYELADAMLRERGNHSEKPNSPTNHDAVPEAIANAESVAPQPTAGDRSGNPTSHSGTGNQPAPPCVETDGFSPCSSSDPINRNAERESPRRECGGSSLRDVARPDTKGKVAGGPEQYISDRPQPVKDCVSDRPQPINADRLAALEELSALDQELELKHGIQGNPMIKAQVNNHPVSYVKSDENRIFYDTKRDTTQPRLYAAPPTWQEEVAAVEAAFERSGVQPTWPADEAGSIGPMAAAMADEIGRLGVAIHSLAEQGATLSVQGGNVTVTVDATLTDEEREAVEQAIDAANGMAQAEPWAVAALRSLLKRLA